MDFRQLGCFPNQAWNDRLEQPASYLHVFTIWDSYRANPCLSMQSVLSLRDIIWDCVIACGANQTNTATDLSQVCDKELQLKHISLAEKFFSDRRADLLKQNYIMLQKFVDPLPEPRTLGSALNKERLFDTTFLQSLNLSMWLASFGGSASDEEPDWSFWNYFLSLVVVSICRPNINWLYARYRSTNRGLKYHELKLIADDSLQGRAIY